MSKPVSTYAKLKNIVKKHVILKGRLPYFTQWSFKLDSMQANYPSAIKHYQRYKLLQDSLFNETKSRQIASLDVLHETERKEKDIQLKEQSIKALTKERLLQEEQIKKDELIRNVIIGGAVLVAAFARGNLQPLPLKTKKQPALRGPATGAASPAERN
jgi:hypothetical protein